MEEQRLRQRTTYDMEMMREIGYCSGIENYSRYFDGRKPGEPPYTLIDYFPDKFLLIVDESHVTLPQVRGMYAGDRSRKQTLVDYGFRLPAAFDNRPLKFDEFRSRIGQRIFVSATPGDYELQQTGGEVVEQVIRPTGLLDPIIEIAPARDQVVHLLGQIRQRVAVGERVLVTALTKRLAEDLATYFTEQGVSCKWLHSELDAFERVDLLRDLREGRFDALVGVNLLREGLDLPEVSLVAILDADKEGFLRSETSLIQTIGRAARNADSRVVMYADHITDSMRTAMDETARRRALQERFNSEHGIVPQTVIKEVRDVLEVSSKRDVKDEMPEDERREKAAIIEEQMRAAAAELDFETAAKLRDELFALRGSAPGKQPEKKPGTAGYARPARERGRKSTKR